MEAVEQALADDAEAVQMERPLRRAGRQQFAQDVEQPLELRPDESRTRSAHAAVGRASSRSISSVCQPGRSASVISAMRRTRSRSRVSGGVPGGHAGGGWSAPEQWAWRTASR